MKKNFLSIITFFFAVCLQAQQGASQSNAPEVSFDSGIVRGILEGDAAVFRGIPYAAPPVGKFRWRPPQPVVSWKGVRDAGKPCAECPQAGWPRGAGMSKTASEDCLFLNIWKPANTTKKAKLPVMVWIHGGGFVAGSGASGDFTGASFVKQDVILVSINYRLGRLGFFCFSRFKRRKF